MKKKGNFIFNVFFFSFLFFGFELYFFFFLFYNLKDGLKRRSKSK